MMCNIQGQYIVLPSEVCKKFDGGKKQFVKRCKI